MNVLILSGSLGKDPERKTFSATGSVVNFTLAETIIGANGEKKTAWHDCGAFGKVSDTIERYCQKGTAVTLTGQLRYDEYENKEGQKVKRAKMNVFSLEITARWKEQPSVAAQPSQQQTPSQGNPEQPEDDLPF